METVASSLTSSFKHVPLSAIAPMLDCVLSCTGVSPSALYASILGFATTFIQSAADGNARLDLNEGTSTVVALCHLLNKLGDASEELVSFICKCLIPLINTVKPNDQKIIVQVMASVFDIVKISSLWDVLGATLVPFVLRAIGISIGMNKSEDIDVFEWDEAMDIMFPESLMPIVDKDLNAFLSSFGLLPFSVSCDLLSLTLASLMQRLQDTCVFEIDYSHLKKVFVNVLWDMCNMTQRLLLSSEHRHCTIRILLPSIFKAFSFESSLEVSCSRHKHKFSCGTFFRKIWQPCKLLFASESAERKDAYSVLSLYMSYFSLAKFKEDEAINKDQLFDVGSDRVFWDEIKKGLIDEERLVRKQSLHILKSALQLCEEKCFQSTETLERTSDKSVSSYGMTKRDLWAEKEAKSMGVGKLSLCDSPIDSMRQWQAYLLLYEMLDEYGTHLVEAAWNHQIILLLKCASQGGFNVTSAKSHPNIVGNSQEIFSWLAILWKLGFFHENPQVRCHVMQSFLDFDWANHTDFVRSVPQHFILGPFVNGLNDSVHHSDFGMKGTYNSKTIEGASKFFRQYATCLLDRNRISFVSNLAAVSRCHAFCRAGLMCLVECVASAARGMLDYDCEASNPVEEINGIASNQSVGSEKVDLLNSLRYILESCKQHYNPKYRLQVCDKVLDVAVLLITEFDLPIEAVLSFISAIPQEFTDFGGSLRGKAQEWLLGCDTSDSTCSFSNRKMPLLKYLQEFPKCFTMGCSHFDQAISVNDEDVDAWECETRRWSRILFLTIKEENEWSPIFLFLSKYGVDICKFSSTMIREKFLLLIISLIMEIEVIMQRVHRLAFTVQSQLAIGPNIYLERFEYCETSVMSKKLLQSCLLFLNELLENAKKHSSILLSDMVDDSELPSLVKGRLGGLSLRRLSSTTTTAVLQAIISVRAVISVVSGCALLKIDAQFNPVWSFLWEFYWKVASATNYKSTVGAELCLAGYETLIPLFRVLANTFSSESLNLMREHGKQSYSAGDDKSPLDILLYSFTKHVNNLATFGALAQARRAVLLNCKWFCLESILLIPKYTAENKISIAGNKTLFTEAAVSSVTMDIMESLENAGEGSILAILRSLRLALGLLTWHCSVSNPVDLQMIWHLVHSSWVLHANSNKRRVACLAALLSSVLHASVFADESMHFSSNGSGPLKWFVECLLEEGSKSPRTIRLAALHLTGLWFSNPHIIKYYVKELKFFTLYGSVAFDEDFEAELNDNHDAMIEVGLLSQSCEPELTREFINTELYARVCIAVLFQKLSILANSSESNKDQRSIALHSGKLFLLELLDSVVNDKELAKELYKKYSAIHRRKVRAWQMICILSGFVTDDIVKEVTYCLHISLKRNNLPGVRQYLETFAINLYLRFPELVRDQLVTIVQDYDTRPQALSSFVFIAANVILHASKEFRSRHLADLLPPIIPLLTSHHHSLRGFAQLLVHQVLVTHLSRLDSSCCKGCSLEKRSFKGLRDYLSENPDCMRLRKSMEGYLDAYDPLISSTPAGIFVNRVEDMQFECVPVSLMEEVLNFLNDVRDELRCSMAKDLVTLKGESLIVNLDSNDKTPQGRQLSDHSLDFQKKISLYEYEILYGNSSLISGKSESCERIEVLEKDDLLLDQLLHSQGLAKEKSRACRQELILVASLLDRIPNIAGLARTCEVFKASGLTIADKSILRDKQFQLISVTADKWVPVIEVPEKNLKQFLEKKKQEGFSILGLEQTANSVPLDQYTFPKKSALVLGREKEGIPVDIIHVLDACIEIPQLGVVRSLNVHVSGAIALWEYTRQRRAL